MAASKDDIRRWFDEGVQSNAHWMIVVCDTYDYEDYPVYANTVEEFDKEYKKHDGVNMQRVMEVYDLTLDREVQMAEKLAFHIPEGWGHAA